MSQAPDTSRRSFLKTSAAIGASAAASSLLTATAHASVNDTIKVGLVGCGGRGSGAAVDALSSDKNAKLVAAADAFEDRVRGSIGGLKKNLADKVAVDDDHIFVGFDAYKKVIDSVDVVLLATPPHFRAEQLAYAVEKGKHVFAEKPVAVDGPGVRSVLETCRKAKEKGLSVVSGLCWRYHYGKRAVLDQIHNGALGDIVTMHSAYNTGELWHRGRKPEWSDMEYQVRNWLYYTWLSGDFITEQHVHSLDKMAWAMKDQYPVKVSSIGGRQARTDPKYGHIYDHFASVFEYANGVKLFSTCRQQNGCTGLVNDYVMGTKGKADIMGHRTEGESNWRFKGKGGNMYRIEHEELFASIRAGKPINNGDYMAKSSLMAIMARMSAYTGKDVTWDQALNSTARLGPEKYDWTDLPEPRVAIPGITKLAEA